MRTVRPARTLAAACLVLVTLLGAAPRPAAALEPPRPLPGYRPTFVTETDTRPWTDCLWASASMLLDKWTNGDVRVSRQRLRTLSGDRRGGSSFEEMAVSFHRLGFDVRYSPYGGERLTWAGLLARLRKGAGAVVLGDDSDLPRRYGRWDYGFWKKDGDKDNHAVYVERYDRRHGRVWLMDPLARGGWHGEWISVRALRRFAWSKGGYVVAAVSPTAKAAPFAGVASGAATVAVSGEALVASWRLRAPKHWRYPGADVHASFAVARDPLAAAAQAADMGVGTAVDQAPRRATARVDGQVLRAAAALPTKAGAYVGRFSLTDRRFGRVVAATTPVAVFVPGPRQAALRFDEPGDHLITGGTTTITVDATNVGQETWADAARDASEASDPQLRDTRLTATWIRVGPRAPAGARAGKVAADSTSPPVIELQRVPLAPGRLARIRARVDVPAELGRWALVVDVVDDLDGSFAALGSEPAVAIFDVVAEHGLSRVD